MPPPRISPELRRALNPFLDALRGVVTDVVKRSAEAAVDTVLEEVEARVENVRDRVTNARANIGRRKPARVDQDTVVVVGPRAKKKKRRKDRP